MTECPIRTIRSKSLIITAKCSACDAIFAVVCRVNDRPILLCALQRFSCRVKNFLRTILLHRAL